MRHIISKPHTHCTHHTCTHTHTHTHTHIHIPFFMGEVLPTGSIITFKNLRHMQCMSMTLSIELMPWQYFRIRERQRQKEREKLGGGGVIKGGCRVIKRKTASRTEMQSDRVTSKVVLTDRHTTAAFYSFSILHQNSSQHQRTIITGHFFIRRKVCKQARTHSIIFMSSTLTVSQSAPHTHSNAFTGENHPSHTLTIHSL